MGARFVKRESAPFELPVTFKREGGDTLDVVFLVEYKGPSALQEWIHRSNGRPDSVVLSEVIRSWNLVDEGDRPIDFGTRAFAEFLDEFSNPVPAFLGAYVMGCTEQREKN